MIFVTFSESQEIYLVFDIPNLMQNMQVCNLMQICKEYSLSIINIGYVNFCRLQTHKYIEQIYYI